MQNRSLVIVSILVLIGAFIGGSMYYKNAQTQKSVELAKQQALLFERPYSVVVGNKDAKVQLVEFFDPACETCALYHPYVKAILEKYEGDVKLVLRYAPFHKNSRHAVKMLLGAKEQGMFTETLDFMYATQTYWTQHHVVKPNILWQMLGQVEGLDMKLLSEFMNDKTKDEIIKQDLADAKTLVVTKTPGFIVNGKPLQTFGLDPLIELIDSELNK